MTTLFSSYPLLALSLYGLVLIFGGFSWLLKNKHYYFYHSWLSTKMWLVITPFVLLVVGYAGSWIPWILAGVSLLALKTYFQLFGLYHQQGLVWGSYLLVLALAFTIRENNWDLYSRLIFLFWIVAALWLIARKTYRKSLQFITLAGIGVTLLGWGLLHLGWIYTQPEGPWHFLFVLGITELAENTQLSLGFGFGRLKPLVGIDRRRSLEGMMVAYGLCLMIAALLAMGLPSHGLKKFWWLLASECFIFSLLGSLLMLAFRKDANIFRYSPFIANRADFLSRVERLVFVAPVYLLTLQKILPSNSH